ncbi:RNA-binding protein [Pediococcus acidilactici]|jgi:RNA-binding protein YlmH|uniref:YlmH/Sll1252 family protein n=1 Tax=Pediococcus acidilactici TaxID=1254 RepID=A0AAP3TZY7_PEDAC|nr:YlmH/Sll1252 family protein [Pediococcus acidilactici]APR28692.1 RNA-binding protein [Pediococcus acidilactici]ARW24739.1 Putative RNA-binding protein YlmH [Pediococcus acidilactici]ARW26795.1 Putative RNA-binding protein YlmH [Pediococcus acidilactici]ARW28857.1 Putative RNA-binding protein YlmH [Pediococcus acidilactici]KAF0333960.1 RNA-binding protein [Pediococcus acidilactici]
MDNPIGQHFRPDEQPLIEEFSALVQEAKDQNRSILTNFLNPRQQHILTTLVNRDEELQLSFFGGFTNAENQRGLIYPQYFVPEKADFLVKIFEIDYPVKFAELEHRQILGTLANSGIQRDTFGDIVHYQDRWQVATNGELEKFFSNEITRIGRIKVRMQLAAPSEILTPVNDWERTQVTLASLRLDSIVATAFSISRHRAKELIEHRQVQLNWMIDEKADTIIARNDVISVRKYGRIKLVEVLGKTKKDKLKTQLDLIKTR